MSTALTLPAHELELLQRLKNSRVVGFLFDPLQNRLVLTFAAPESEVRVSLSGIVQLNYSNTVYEGAELPQEFISGDVTLVPVRDGGEKILTYLNHQFVHSDNYSQVQYFPSVLLYYLHVAGEVVLDVVGTGYVIEQLSLSQQ